MKQKRKTGFQISYVAITYRSVFLSVVLLLAIAAVVTSFAFPDLFTGLTTSGELGLGRVLAKVGLAGRGASRPEPGPKQAHFTNIDGTVGEFIQNGHKILVRGRTEPGAMVLVNGQQEFTEGDGPFSHFTSNLPAGENIITITAQNSRGGVI